MFELSQREYEQKQKKINRQNESYERKQALKKSKKGGIKIPSASKIVLFSMFLLCLEIVIFAEYAMLKLENMTALYALIGIPASLIPVIMAYYNKSKAENTKGGITYETAMAGRNNMDTSIKDEENACG